MSLNQLTPAQRLRRPLCLASALLLAASGVSAEMSLRGQLDLSVGQVRGLAGRVMQTGSDVGGASYLAVQAREIFGGGWQAVAVLDAGLQADTGLGRVNNDPGTPALNQPGFSFNRRAVVGLRGPSGELLLGRDYHPLTYAGFAADPLGLSFWGNLAGVTQMQSGRFNNGLFLRLDPGPGWTLRAAVGLGNEGPAGSARGEGRSLGLGYSAHGWDLQLAALSEHTGAGPAFALPAADARVDTLFWGLSRRGQPAAAASGRAQSWRWSVGGSRITGRGRIDGHERSALWLGGEWRWGPAGTSTRVLGLLGRTLSRPGRAWTGALAAEQELSLRTALYASAARVRNDALSNVALAAAIPQVGATGPAAAGGLGRGVTLQALSVGIRHRF